MSKDTVYIFKVVQSDTWSAPRIRGMPTVKLTIEPDKTLYQLAKAILEAFYFENDHMIGFYGDEWHFIIDFLKEEKKKNDERYPKILDRKGEPFPQYPNDDGFIIEILKK